MPTEVLQAETAEMEIRIEKKCRRAEGIIPSETEEQINQHFLSAGPGSSQDCRD
ncbi:hypothetical protein A2U01_0050898 [Trifolium medium]|uniref:Uncharacterized protein n=1 Tax=Trifolium medium TaxID=97028 RepID=A0A392R0C5_9FABA|nr:hypothetical protein [Trifolium medium]